MILVGSRVSTSSLPRSTVAAEGLRHALVVGGTVRQWREATEARWRERIETLGAVALASGASWLTLRPYGDDGEDHGMLVRSEHHLTHGDATCVVIVEPMADGRTRFATAMADLDPAVDVTESAVADALYRPAEAEPDLVLVLGDDRTLPPSLVWELGYAELVFSDVSWDLLAGDDLARAIGEFTSRNRRFGGLP